MKTQKPKIFVNIYSVPKSQKGWNLNKNRGQQFIIKFLRCTVYMNNVESLLHKSQALSFLQTQLDAFLFSSLLLTKNQEGTHFRGRGANYGTTEAT